MKEHKLAAIVFTDIVGYTKRMEADEEATMLLLERQREIIFPLVQEFDGEVIKEIGDGLLIMFNSANKAVRFSIAVQERLKDEELTIRAGIHIGDVIFEEGDVFGSAVNIAARIEPLAPPGGICISEDVRNQIRNQGDIITFSEGKKNLKGVNEAIEIFKVVNKMFAESESVPFFRDIWRRRVVQITAIYLALAYSVRMLMSLIVGEYMLSPHLVDLVWFLLMSLIPSILLISYFHGRRGVTHWTRWELIGLPTNFVAAILLLFFLFQGKDMGAITTTLTMHNEDGEAVERVVLKNEFRKNILIFNFENISGDTSLDYLQYGVPALMQMDLSQDLFINPLTTKLFLSKIRDAGYEEAVGLPITLMKRYADQRHYNYFVCGDVKKDGDEYAMDVKVYETALTKLLDDIHLGGKDPFEMVDKASLEIKRIVGINESQIASAIDLPIAEMFTGSEKALYFFSRSIDAESRNDWIESNRLLELAIHEDPSFAIANVAAALSYLNLGNLEKASDNLTSVMNYLHKLPERQQFVAKYIYYVIELQPDKAMAVLKMWVELYPDDIVGHATLAERYGVKNLFNEAIVEYKKLLALDPERFEILQTIAFYYMKLGEFDSSLVYYQNYADALPMQSQSYRNLGNYYQTMGDMEKARESYEKALLVADMSELVSIKIDLAKISRQTGEFSRAYDQCLDALNDARGTQDSAKVYGAFEDLCLVRGQAEQALAYYEKKLVEYKKFLPPRSYNVYQIFTINIYAEAGKEEQAFRKLEELDQMLEPPLNKLPPFGYMMIYAEIGQAEKASQAMAGAEDIARGFGEEQLMNNIYYTGGRISELTGKYADAIAYYRKYLENNADDYSIHTNIARCYRKLKDYNKAEEEILINLKHRPFSPKANYEAALFYLEQDENNKALQYLERAVDIWKDADNEYVIAGEAKAKLAELKGV